MSLHTILIGSVVPFLFPYTELCPGLLCASSSNCDFCWLVHCKYVFYIFGVRATRVNGKEEKSKANTSLDSSADLDLSLTASPGSSLSWTCNQAFPQDPCPLPIHTHTVSTTKRVSQCTPMTSPCQHEFQWRAQDCHRAIK